MKSKTVFFLVLIILEVSCKKISNNKIDANIYVKQFKTETPIANAEVQILRGKPGAGYGTELVETTYTDADGKATYKTKVDRNYDYFAFARVENCYNEDNQVILSRGKRDFNVTIFKYANSYVKLHVKNIHPFNQYDLVQIKSLCNTYNFQGQNIDTIFLWCEECNCSWLGNNSFQTSFFYTRNNITNVGSYSFTTIPFDTITVLVNY